MKTPLSVGYCLCGSFCTLAQSITVLCELAENDYLLHPIMSEITYSTDTRFGRCEDFRSKIETICGRPILHTIPQVEPIGPKNYLDALVVAPCTANTLGKIANGIYDSSVTIIIILLLLAISTAAGMNLLMHPHFPRLFVTTDLTQI